MNLSFADICINIALHFMTWTMFLCALFVWMQHGNNPKQRKIFAITRTLTGLFMFTRVILVLKTGGVPPILPVLPIGDLYGGFWALLLLFFYPVEVVNPGWLKFRIVLPLFVPIAVVSIVLLVYPIEFRLLYSVSDIIKYAGEYNVWFRLLILFLFIAPYSVLLLCAPYNWRVSSADVRWARIYVVGMQGIVVLYIALMLTGSLVAGIMYLVYCTLFLIYTTYQELFLRLFPPAIEFLQEMSKSICVEIKTTLWGRLEDYMRGDEPWRSPNITISDVAKCLASNRTTLSAEIRSQGFATFHDLVALYRIDDFCRMVERGDVSNINEAFCCRISF